MMVFYNWSRNRGLDGYFSSWRVWGFRRGRFAASWKVWMSEKAAQVAHARVELGGRAAGSRRRSRNLSFDGGVRVDDRDVALTYILYAGRAWTPRRRIVGDIPGVDPLED